MRVADWRARGGLDVLVHAVAHGGALDAAIVREIFEARRLLLAEAAALAADRRTDEQATLLSRLAGELAAADLPDEIAQGLDMAFMATVIEAAGNVAFSLIANSIRDVYLEHADLFRAIVARRDELGYAGVAAAVGAREASGARAAMAALGGAQEARLLAALGGGA
jgi:DNA-binding FadR family transcriptional regulator